MELTERDREIVAKLKRTGVLDNIDPHRVNSEEGLILVTCSDGDRFWDIFTKKVEVVTAKCNHPRIHVFSWHGGALRLAKMPSPLGELLLRLVGPLLCRLGIELINPFQEIADAREMKRIDTVALVVHAACGYAYGRKLDFLQVMDGLVKAKNNLKKRIPGIKVKLYPHVHYGPGKDKSYFTSREAWAAYEHHLRELDEA